MFVHITVRSPLASLMQKPEASETMLSPGTSKMEVRSKGGPPVLSIESTAPIFYAIGKNPDATGTTNHPRQYFDPARATPQEKHITVEHGDKFAWVDATT